jgi:hypothetical protein
LHLEVIETGKWDKPDALVEKYAKARKMKLNRDQ